MKLRIIICGLVMLAFGVTFGSAQASFVWVGSVDGDIANIANWYPGVPAFSGTEDARTVR